MISHPEMLVHSQGSLVEAIGRLLTLIKYSCNQYRYSCNNIFKKMCIKGRKGLESYHKDQVQSAVGS